MHNLNLYIFPILANIVFGSSRLKNKNPIFRSREIEMAHFNWDHLKEKLGLDSYQSEVKVCHHMSILIYYILNYPKEYILSQ